MRFVIFTSAIFLAQLVSAWAETPPNIVLIVSDDQGYRDLGCFGSEEIKTPHLDKLAAGGIKLTSFYVAWPACTPSRASLLTGRYPQRNGIYDMIRNEAPDYGYKYKPAEYEVTFERIGGMDLREILLTEMLKKAGYQCGIFGKWDLGSLQRFLPTARGFDDFYGFVNTGIDYFTHERYGVPSMYRDFKPTTEDFGTYCTELFRREAMNFLSANQTKPFFLYLPFNAPHSASNLNPAIRSAPQAVREYLDKYPHLKETFVERENFGKYSKPAKVKSKEYRRKEYLASVTHMDDVIGDVLNFLEEKKLAENTIVIFFSDNGGGGGSDNSPLKGGKGQMFEGGIRVPCIVRYPKKIPAGKTSGAFLTSLELVPTLTKLAGVEVPVDLKLDGYDMLPMLAEGKPSPRTEMFWQRRDDVAVRMGDWKYVKSSRGNGLFNLKDDIGERKDLSKTNSSKLEEMQDRLKAWQREMKNCEPRGPFRDF